MNFHYKQIGDGKEYKGYGSEPSVAQEASAEAALISFLQLPAQSPEDDKTPWGVFTSFAVFRMLREWREVNLRAYNHQGLYM